MDCDCWFGHWVLVFGIIVRICPVCCSIDDGYELKTPPCACVNCVSALKAHLTPHWEHRTVMVDEGPPTFIDRLAQHVFNSFSETTSNQRLVVRLAGSAKA